MPHTDLIQHIVAKLKNVPGLKAIVLGGSWASGHQQPDSDIDLALYYTADDPLDIHSIRQIAFELNDTPNPTVTDLGGWGKWVNGGAWLTIQNLRVDFLYRNINFVSKILEDCNRGETQLDYLQQPPYGFYSYIYCTETHICQILYDPSEIIQKLKSKVTHYPQPLKSTIINNCMWNAEFSLEVAKKPAKRGDVYFVAGCLTRIASNLIQVLYALNETYFISDKRLSQDESTFSIKPTNFSERINNLLGTIGCNTEQLSETIAATETLVKEVVALCADQYTPRFQLIH